MSGNGRQRTALSPTLETMQFFNHKKKAAVQEKPQYRHVPSMDRYRNSPVLDWATDKTVQPECTTAKS